MKEILNNNKFLISVLVGILYFIINLKSRGPTYQQDEIGYLINAAFLVGNVVDGYSSYHSGYSIFLAPIYLLLRNPFDLWPAVVFINSMFWGGSFYISLQIINKIYPNLKLGNIIFAMICCFAYSSWISITGYAFTQSCYIFFYLLSIFLLITGLINKGMFTANFSISVGFLYWIHPTALGPILASFLMIIASGICQKKYLELAKHISIVMFMVIIHKFGIQVAMESIMTPSDFVARAHYPSTILVLNAALSVKFWLNWLLIILGQITYLTIASFGMFLIGAITCTRLIFTIDKINEFKPIDNVKKNVSVYLILSILIVAAITGASFASQSHGPSVDELFYGRYIESVLLPLFLIGAIEYKKVEDFKILILCLSTIAIGYTINEFAGKFTWINLVNLQGFWPYLVFKQNLAVCFFIGITFVAFVLRIGNRMILVPIVLIYALAIIENKNFHNNLYNAYSKPSEMIGFLRNNFKSGQCVAFDEFLPKEHTNLMAERIRLYSFYLYDYKFSRQHINNWFVRCDGPMLSFKNYQDFKEPVNLIARERSTGLGLFIKRSECGKLKINCDKIEEF